MCENRELTMDATIEIEGEFDHPDLFLMRDTVYVEGTAWVAGKAVHAAIPVDRKAWESDPAIREYVARRLREEIGQAVAQGLSVEIRVLKHKQSGS